MKELKFKTNINCSGCVEKVTPALNNAKGVSDWKVNTTNADKILTIQSEGIESEEIIKTVQNAGFNIESIK